MNLIKLFESQRKLDEVIISNNFETFEGKSKEELIDNRVLALFTETGESANEWRGFKLWSKNQKPNIKTEILCNDCKGVGVNDDYKNQRFLNCKNCEGEGFTYKSPLLEEHVDKLHFILSDWFVRDN